jgi:hypothetical protein
MSYRSLRGRVADPVRWPLRYDLDIFCSISQNIQTKAAPRPITTIRNSKVNAGAESMFNILDQMQTAFHRTESGLATRHRSGAGQFRRDLP